MPAGPGGGDRATGGRSHEARAQRTPRGGVITDHRRFNLTPAELQAIEEHKYFLSLERGAEVSIEEAIEDFLARFAEHWRREKARRDMLDQHGEIRRLQERDDGGDMEGRSAAEEWCERHAAIWRAERESLERNGFRRVDAIIRNPDTLRLGPWSTVAAKAARYDCDVYVHRPGMPHWNFLLEGRPFTNVKSVVGLLSLGIQLGDRLVFIATGAEKEDALVTLWALVEGVRAGE